MTEPAPVPDRPASDVSLPESAVPVALNLQTLDVPALNAYLRGLEEPAGEVRVVGAAGQSGLATGLGLNVRVHIQGNAGAYLGLLNAGATLDLFGDAGAACGHSMTSGDILVRGRAGHSLAAFARGGFIGVHGTAQHACALGLGGADVVVRQSVGPRAAHRMRAGNLVLGSDAGEELGEGCTGGTIFVRGNAVSVAHTLREVRMRESDAMRLGLLLVRAGIKSATREFRVYRPRAQAVS